MGFGNFPAFHIKAGQIQVSHLVPNQTKFHLVTWWPGQMKFCHLEPKPSKLNGDWSDKINTTQDMQFPYQLCIEDQNEETVKFTWSVIPGILLFSGSAINQL